MIRARLSSAALAVVVTATGVAAAIVLAAGDVVAVADRMFREFR